VKRWLQAMVLALSLAFSVLPPAAGQEAVEFRLRVSQGETLYYALTVTLEEDVVVPGTRRTDRGEGTAREAVRVIDVATDGSVHLEVALENYRLRSGSSTEEPVSAPQNMRVRGDGRVLELDTGKETDRYYVILPDRPIRTGESWTRRAQTSDTLSLLPFGIIAVTHDLTETRTLESVEAGGDRIARIRGRIEGTSTSPWTPILFGQARVRGTIRGTEELHWSLERGRVVRFDSEITEEFTLEIMTFGQSSSGKVTERATIRRAALPAEGATGPEVAAEFLIVPGKSIGATTLEMTVTDITGRLGPPAASPDNTMWGADRGFRAQVRNWRGLVGYLDSADETRLAGLGIVDRRYRTAKGVGFGSAHGAVLFAYGMTPPRIEMRGQGIVTRVLIYDDQGIAFGFTGDKTHPGGAQGPLGSLDWIIVFAPGGAAKVFTMP
jgi:hypothetical protein